MALRLTREEKGKCIASHSEEIRPHKIRIRAPEIDNSDDDGSPLLHLSNGIDITSLLSTLTPRALTLPRVMLPESNFLRHRNQTTMITPNPPEPPVPPDPPPASLPSIQLPCSHYKRSRLALDSLENQTVTSPRLCTMTHNLSTSLTGKNETSMGPLFCLIVNHRLQAKNPPTTARLGYRKARPLASPAHDGNRVDSPISGGWRLSVLSLRCKSTKHMTFSREQNPGHCSAVDEVFTPASHHAAKPDQETAPLLWASIISLMGLLSQKLFEPIKYFSFLKSILSAKSSRSLKKTGSFSAAVDVYTPAGSVKDPSEGTPPILWTASATMGLSPLLSPNVILDMLTKLLYLTRISHEDNSTWALAKSQPFFFFVERDVPSIFFFVKNFSKSSAMKASRAPNFVHPLVIVGELPLSKERRLLSTIVTILSYLSFICSIILGL